MHTTTHINTIPTYYPVSSYLQIMPQFGFKKSALRLLDYTTLVALFEVDIADVTPEVVAKVNEILKPRGMTFNDVVWDTKRV